MNDRRPNRYTSSPRYTQTPAEQARDYVPVYPSGYTPRESPSLRLTDRGLRQPVDVSALPRSAPTASRTGRSPSGPTGPTRCEETFGQRPSPIDWPARLREVLTADRRLWEPAALARKLGTSAPNLSQALYQMYERGQVERLRHPTNPKRWVYRGLQEGAA